MKSTLTIIFMAAMGCAAQTNLITFTNAHGVVISNAKITATNAIDVFYETSNGPSHVHWSDIPPGLQARFGYDPAKGAAAQKELALRKQALAEASVRASVDLQMQKDASEQKARADKTKMLIQGKVIQRLSAGLLVDSASELRSQIKYYPGDGPGLERWDLNGVQVFDGLCLLTDVERGAVDGDIINCVAYPNGTYDYTAVSGGEKSVRRFTANANFITETPSEKEMELMKQSRPY